MAVDESLKCFSPFAVPREQMQPTGAESCVLSSGGETEERPGCFRGMPAFRAQRAKHCGLNPLLDGRTGIRLRQAGDQLRPGERLKLVAHVR